jgi:hypothetical protein
MTYLKIMKKVIIMATVAVMAAVGATAQSARNPTWRKTDEHWARKNSVTALGSLFGWNAYHSWGVGHIGLEYDRFLRRGLSVSAIGLFAPMYGSGRESFSFAGAKANYSIPVVRNWLFFRVGIGGGIGWYRAVDFPEGVWNEHTPRPAPGTYVKPHLMVDAYWVLRVTRRLDLRFSPLLYSPSQFIVGGRIEAPHIHTTFKYINWGTLGVTVRF